MNTKTIDIEQEYQKKLHELNIILKVSQSIIGTLDFQKVLQVISDGMSELLEIESAAIYLIENQSELFLGATTPAMPPNMEESLRIVYLNQHPNIQETILSKQAHVLNDTMNSQLSPAETKVVKMRNLRSLLYLPFVHDKKVLGVLILGTINKTRHFSDYEINMGQTVANQLSIAIENARLNLEANNHKAHLELLLKRKTKDLDEAINQIHEINEEVSEKNEELKATLKHLKETQAQLFQIEKMASLGVLTAGVAHEINNPLNYIMGACEGLESYFDEHNSSDAEHTQMLLKCLKLGVSRVTAIVNGLDQFSSTSNDLNDDCDIHSIIENCIDLLHSKLKNILIDYHFCNGNLKLRGNNSKLHQVFLNILNNAVQSIDGEGKIIIVTTKNENSACIEITDNGIGISPADLSKITDPFYTTKSPGDGSGLGLYVTYHLVNEHHGKIQFSSEKAKGTTVTITLPQVI